MAFISWPDQTELGGDFVYDNTAGTGVTVYIVDSGAGLANNDVSLLFPIGGNDTTENSLRSSPNTSLRTKDTSKPKVRSRTMTRKMT